MNDDLHTFIEPGLQARITALVLGEASEFERDELEKLIAEKPELEIHRRRMLAIHGLLEDAVKPADDPAWKLSQEKREHLRRTFSKKPEPAPGSRGRSKGTARTQVRAAAVIAACVLVTVILFSMATPTLYKKSSAERATPETASYRAAASEKAELRQEDVVWAPEAPPRKSEIKTRNVERKPSVPRSDMSRIIAANTTPPTAVPVPETSVPNPTTDFGSGDDFGDGWGGAESGDYAVTRDSADSLLKNRPKGVRTGEAAPSMKWTAGLSMGYDDNAQPESSIASIAEKENATRGVAGGKPKTVNGVRKGLYKGEGYYNLGQYDKAEAEMKKVLQKDPYNKAARLWLEKVAATKSDYYRAAYDHTRAELLAEVDRAWETTVPPEVSADVGRPVARPAPAPKPAHPKLARVQSELQKQSAIVADKRRKLMEVAEKVGVIWVESERGGETIGGELELRQLAEKQLYEAEREREQLKFQIDKLLQVNDEDLPSLAAELPDVGFKGVYEKLEKEKSALATLKASGQGEKHPDVMLRETKVKELEKNLQKRALNVRKSLRHRLSIIEGRTKRMREIRDKKQDEGTDRARAFQEFNKLRKEYETAQNIKDQAQIRYDIEKTKLAIPPTKLEAKPGARTIAPPARPKALPDETLTRAEPFSTFSLNVNDVSFKLARAALLENGKWPDAAKVRTEEFVNAFDYGDPSPRQTDKVSCAVEQAAHPFLQQRNLLRIGMKTAAMGRSQPLRLTVLLDNSGSMEREDREASVLAAMQVLAAQLNAQDVISVVSFARQPRLIADRVPGNQAGKIVDLIARTPSEGGTNIEEALRLARTLAKRQHAGGAQSRVVLITDGIANLGNTVPEELSDTVEAMRQEGIAFDACGVGAEGLNDEILEALTRKGDGRYYFLNRPEDADDGFAKQLAGALAPAAKNVKVQVVFNPGRVTRYRLLGFEKHRLNKEDFRNDKVDAAEMAAEEAGNAVYQIQVNPQGSGELGEVFVRFLDASTGSMVERSWPLPYEPQAKPFDLAAPSMQLAGTAAMLGEKLHGTDAGSVRFNMISDTLGKLQAHYAADKRVQDLVRMCRKVE